MTKAIGDFQRFAGLEETGKLDESTIRMMRTPRCGKGDSSKALPRYKLQSKF